MRSTAVILIFSLSLLGSAGDIGFSPSYAQAQVDYREISPGGDGVGGPPAGQPGGTPSGQPGATGQTGGTADPSTGTTPGITVSGVVDAVAASPTSLGFAVNVAQGNSPTVSQSVAAAGSAISLGLSLAGVTLGISLAVAAVVALVAIAISLFSGPADAPPGTSDSPGVDAPGTDAGGNAPSGPPGPAATGETPAGGGYDVGAPAPGGDGGCFKAGTFVATAMSEDGRITYRSIETFRAGDEVLGVAFDAEGNPVLKAGRVLQPLRHEAKQYPFSRLIAADGTAIVGTSNHVIITSARNEGVRMEGLSRGRTIVTVVGTPQWDSVEEVASLADEVTPVFNIETTTDNYLVSQDGKGWILVHNGGGK